MTTIWKKKSDTDCERKKDCWRGRCTSAPDIGRADGGGLWPVSDAWRFWLHQSAGLYKGFPWHPHRGIETITYLVSGTMEHEDSLGNKGVIQSMGCQWMTAGSGILHKEMPQPSERMLGCQLWVNLPAAKKWFHRHIGTLLRMTSRWWCPTRQPSGSYQAATGDTGDSGQFVCSDNIFGCNFARWRLMEVQRSTRWWKPISLFAGRLAFPRSETAICGK